MPSFISVCKFKKLFKSLKSRKRIFRSHQSHRYQCSATNDSWLFDPNSFYSRLVGLSSYFYACLKKAFLSHHIVISLYHYKLVSTQLSPREYFKRCGVIFLEPRFLETSKQTNHNPSRTQTTKHVVSATMKPTI